MSVHIAAYRGDDTVFPFTLTRGGLPVDLSTATVVFSGRIAADFAVDEAPAFSLTSGTDIEILADQSGTEKGMVEVTIPASVSVDLALGLYLCDIEVTDTEVWTWPEAVYGQSTLIRLRVKADVTHP
jgi:hypothetical protein